MKKYTITEFRAEYPDNNACLDKIFKLRYEGLVCPKCDNDKPFTRVKNRRSYQCPCCGFQVYPTQGTIFEKTTTPLTHWFYAIYLQTTTRNGVAAKELERQLNICYKTALRIAHQIKKLMNEREDELLTGIVEVDETLVGGKIGNKHKSERFEKNWNDKKIDHKQLVIGFLSRGLNVRVEIVNDTDFKNSVRKYVDKSSTVVTDGHKAYRGLDKEYTAHEFVDHQLEEYVRGNWHTNSIEGFWAHLKRTINGTHIHVSERHLQKYIDEVAFRYSHRFEQDKMFELILQRMV